MVLMEKQMQEGLLPHPARVEVSLGQLRSNIYELRKLIGKSLYCLPLKANAYGHGLCKIGLEAQKAGVDYLAVAHVNEGVSLRKAGVLLPILVLGAFCLEDVAPVSDYKLELTIASSYQAKWLEKRLNGKKCRVHLKVDTGMRRLGVLPREAKTLFSYLENSGSFDVVGIYSHFARANNAGDSFTEKQIASFKRLRSDPVFMKKKLIWHICNSGGTLFFPQAHFDMVRPGLFTFGCLPRHCEKKLLKVAPCLSLKAQVAHSKIVSKGCGVSYEHSFVTLKKSRIVTIPIGYGDGFLRFLSNKGKVLLQNRFCPIVGNICMDQFMVDAGALRVEMGEEAVLIGRQGGLEISAREIADSLGTIPYEVLCLLNERIPRIYTD